MTVVKWCKCVSVGFYVCLYLKSDTSRGVHRRLLISESVPSTPSRPNKVPLR